MKFIRWFLGRIILMFNALFTPKGIQRSTQAQQAVDEKAKSLALYQFQACPFCVKVRRAMARQSVNIELRDAQNNATHKETLLTQGGKGKVPCLRIEQDGHTTWMYESSEIVAYLEREFA